MTSTDIELRAGNGHVSREWIALLEPAAALANQVAGTGFVPRAMQGNPAAIVAAILYGDELGLGPMQALAKISVIEGKPSLSAEAQRALILAAGHEFRPTESTATRVTLFGKRADTGAEASVTWTLDDAKRANLAGKQNWRLYPRQMLAARATAELARLLFADVIGGLAATEELEDVDEFDLGPYAGLEPAPEKKPTTRRRRKKTSVALDPGVDPESVTDRPEGTEAGNAAPDLPPLPDEPAETLLEPAPEAPAEPEPGEPRGDSPADDGLDLGESAGGTSPADDTGEVAQDDETTASSVTSDDDVASPVLPSEPDEDVSSFADPPATGAQKKALNSLVGRLRTTEVELEDRTKTAVLSTAQLWAAAATRRNVSVDVMIELLEGKDEAGVLHWSPLRDSLTKSEASDLIGKLEDRARKWGVE